MSARCLFVCAAALLLSAPATAEQPVLNLTLQEKEALWFQTVPEAEPARVEKDAAQYCAQFRVPADCSKEQLYYSNIVRSEWIFAFGKPERQQQIVDVVRRFASDPPMNWGAVSATAVAPYLKHNQPADTSYSRSRSYPSRGVRSYSCTTEVYTNAGGYISSNPYQGVYARARTSCR